MWAWLGAVLGIALVGVVVVIALVACGARAVCCRRCNAPRVSQEWIARWKRDGD